MSPRRGHEDPVVNSAKICELYKKRACPHGRTGTTLVNGNKCDKSHPKRCFKYCDYGSRDRKGCKKGKSCDFWHPRLCSNSMKDKRCTKANCTFFHLRGTIRNNEERRDGADQRQNRAPVKPERSADINPRGLRYNSIASTTAGTYTPTRLLSYY